MSATQFFTNMPDLSSFKEKFIDTKIVDKVSWTCFGAFPIVNPIQVEFAAGSKMHSFTAGITFHSPTNEKFPNFKIVFCAKLHSKIFRRDPSNRSHWYIWQPVGRSGALVIDSDKCEKEYGFDVYAFFRTKEFKEVQKKMKSYIQKGITAAKALAKDVEKEKQNDYNQCIKSLEEAAEIVMQFPTIEEKNQKLVNYDAFIDELKKQGYGGELKTRGGAMTDYARKVGTRFVDKVKRNALKAGEQDRAAKAGAKK